MLSIVPFLLLAFVGQSSATCYNPDGSEIKDPAYQPCNQFAGTVSQCCGTNHTGGVVAPDTCQPNGLCQNNGDSVYWRQGCTDKTWKSPFCLNLCTDRASGGNTRDNVAVGQCSDGSWCCGGVNATCCNLKQGVAIAATIGVILTTSTAPSSTSSVSTTGSPSSTANATPTPSPSAPTPLVSNTSRPDSGMGSGAKIGIGVGIAGVAIAILAIALFFILRSRRNKIPRATPAGGVDQYAGQEHNGISYHEVAESKRYPPAYPVEAPPNTYRAEAPANIHRAELGS